MQSQEAGRATTEIEQPKEGDQSSQTFYLSAEDSHDKADAGLPADLTLSEKSDPEMAEIDEALQNEFRQMCQYVKL
jgi:hypothetical protein